MIDWTQIVTNLRRAGVSAKFIMKRTGVSDRTVYHLQNGTATEPRFSRGLELLKLHAKFCPVEHERDVYEKC